jgi:hypothetical protein
MLMVGLCEAEPELAFRIPAAKRRFDTALDRDPFRSGFA